METMTREQAEARYCVAGECLLDEVLYVAQDANGEVYGYSVAPRVEGKEWVPYGDTCVDYLLALTHPPKDFTKTLVKVAD